MSRLPTGATVVAFLTLALLLAACGAAAAAPPKAGPTGTPVATEPTEPTDPGDAEPTPGTTLDACQIVTPADVQAALDADIDVEAGALKAAPTILSPGHTECTYDGDFGGVLVSLTPEDGANLYDAARGAYKDAVDITGTGADGAFFSKENRRAFVWKGAVTVMLTIFPASGGPTYEHSEALAIRIVEKL